MFFCHSDLGLKAFTRMSFKTLALAFPFKSINLNEPGEVELLLSRHQQLSCSFVKLRALKLLHHQFQSHCSSKL